MTAGPRRPQRRAHGDFFLACDRARQLQVGHVSAGNQQHEPNRAQQQIQRPSNVADHLLHQGHNAERQSAVWRIYLGMVLPQPRGDRIHLRLRLLHADPRPQLADDVVVLVVAILGRVGRKWQRQQHLGLLGAIERRHHFARQRERSRHHAHHFVRHAVQRDRLAQDCRVRSRNAAPMCRSSAMPLAYARAGPRQPTNRRPIAARIPSMGSRFDDTRIVPTRSGSPLPVRL